MTHRLRTTGLSFISIDMIRHHDQSDLQKKMFIEVHSSRGLEPMIIMAESEAAPGRHGAEAGGESLHPNPQMWSRESKVRKTLETSKPIPRDIHLTARLHFLIPPFHQLETTNSEPKGTIFIHIITLFYVPAQLLWIHEYSTSVVSERQPPAQRLWTHVYSTPVVSERQCSTLSLLTSGSYNLFIQSSLTVFELWERKFHKMSHVWLNTP